MRQDLMFPLVLGAITFGMYFEFKARRTLDAEQRNKLRVSSRQMNKPLFAMAVVVMSLSLLKGKLGPPSRVTSLSAMAVITLSGVMCLMSVEKKLSRLALPNSYYQLHRRSLIALCTGASVAFVAGCLRLIGQ